MLSGCDEVGGGRRISSNGVGSKDDGEVEIVRLEGGGSGGGRCDSSKVDCLDIVAKLTILFSVS